MTGKPNRISQTMNVNRFVVEDKDGTVRVHAYLSGYVAGEAQQRLEYGYGVVCWIEKDI